MAAPATAENRTATTAPTLEFILRGAMAALEEVAAGAPVVAPVPVPVPEPVPLPLLEMVLPKLDDVVAGRVVVGTVAGEVLLPVPVPVPLAEVEVAVLAPMENVPVFPMTLLMSPISTASKVYPSPTGTTGKVRVS